MNLPSNFKKQLQHKKEKKEIISKQNNIVTYYLNFLIITLFYSIRYDKL
jgi:hypothetical protein